MNLTDAQKEAVTGWVADGLKLSEIQSRISESFEVSLTYMDVRFLIEDLELQLKEQPKPVDSDLRNVPPPPGNEAIENEQIDASDKPSADSSVSVLLHNLYKPGVVVSGDVTFSDGEKVGWSLDQTGRLALNPTTEGYQPSQDDLQEFQKELSMVLQSRGL